MRDRLTEFIPNPTFEIIAAPGAHMAYYAGQNDEGKTLRELTGEPIRCPDAFRRPGPRLELLDEQGIHASLMFPTLASLVEERLIDDPDLTMVAIGAFNEWLFDEWGYDHEGRIFATPVVNPCGGDKSLTQLERIIERGAKAALPLRPAPVSGLRGTRSPFLAEFDPFWARIQEAGLLASLRARARQRGYQNYLNTWEWRGTGEFVAVVPLQKTLAAWSPTTAGPSRTPSPRRSATGCSPASPTSTSSASRTAGAGSATSSATSNWRTRRCPTSSPSTRATCSPATCGSTRSGRTRCTASSI